MGRRRFQQPEVFKSGGKRPLWFFRARVDVTGLENGERTIKRPLKKYYLGYVDEMGKQEARQKRNEILDKSINKPQILIPSQVRFWEVLDAYKRDHLPNLRETTQTVQESIIKQHIRPGLGKLRLCDIDTATLQRWLSSMDAAKATKKDRLDVLKVIWTKAEDWGYTQARFPARNRSLSLGVDRPVKGHEMPTMDQIRRLLAALPEPYRAMAEVILCSGLRISEVRGLQWQDVGDHAILIRRRVSEAGDVDVPKSKKAWRSLDVRPLKSVLARLPHDSEWIFLDSGKSYAQCNWYIVKARGAAGITIARFGWHHLRAIFNTLIRSKGGDDADRMEMMGHATESMNRAYIFQSPEDLQRQGDLMLSVQELIMGPTKGVQ